MGEVPTMRERDALDRHITGNHGEDSNGEPYELPILLAWAMVDKRHCPVPAETMNAFDKALSVDEFGSDLAASILVDYFDGLPNTGDAEKDEARRNFQAGWTGGIEREEISDETLDANQDGWQVGGFSYLFGLLTGHFAYVLEYDQPHVKTAD